MFFKKFSSFIPKALGLVAMGITLHSGLASADVYNVGTLPQAEVYTQAVSRNGSFADIFNFHLNSVADISGAASVLNLDLGASSILHIDSPVLALFNVANPGSAIASGNTNVFASSLNAGDYFVKFTGNANGVAGGSYLMGLYSVVTAAVPEPEQWALLLAGLVAVGVASRRKYS